MSKFFIGDETVRVPFADGEWVDVKAELSQTDMDYITSQMMQASVNTDGKEKPEASVQMVFGKQALLDRSVVAWSFAEDGKEIPVTPENISNLRARYRVPVLTEIDRITRESQAFAKN